MYALGGLIGMEGPRGATCIGGRRAGLIFGGSVDEGRVCKQVDDQCVCHMRELSAPLTVVRLRVIKFGVAPFLDKLIRLNRPFPSPEESAAMFSA